MAKKIRKIPIEDELSVLVRDRNGIIFAGQALAVSSQNKQGPFDVLPQHENFITLIDTEITIHIVNEQEKTIPMETGILKIHENNVEVYFGIVR